MSDHLKTIFRGTSRLSYSICLALMLTIFFSGIAQEKMEVARQDFSGGITMQFDGQQLEAIGNLITIADSSGHQLALLNILLDGEKRWSRMSAETPEPENVVHWYYDEAGQQLVVDLSKLRSAITAQSTLSLSVAVLNTRNNRFKLSAYDAEKQAEDQLSVLSKIKDVDIDVQ